VSPALEPMPDDWGRALAVIAHPDDMEYGATAAVARWTQAGKDVAYLLVTRGEAGIDSIPPWRCGPAREAEERRSAAVVGVGSVEFIDYTDGVVEYGLGLRRDIAAAIRRQRLEMLLTINYELTWGTTTLNMADHRNVGLAVLDATRDAGNRWIVPDLADAGLEPWNGVRWVCVAGMEPTHYVDVSNTIDAGIASLREHALYLAQVDMDADSWLRDMAAHTGAQAGCDYAVGFRVIRI
jgi:LmbE family N-acetylglucosaminyl deacetylase